MREPTFVKQRQKLQSLPGWLEEKAWQGEVERSWKRAGGRAGLRRSIGTETWTFIRKEKG